MGGNFLVFASVIQKMCTFAGRITSREQIRKQISRVNCFMAIVINRTHSKCFEHKVM